MIIFNGLKDMQAVFWSGKYVVQLPRGTFLDADGNTLPVGQVVVDILDIKEQVKEPARIEKYIFADGTEKTPADYNALQGEMGQYMDDDGDFNYPSIDVEFDIRKRLQEFHDAEKVYTDPVTYQQSVEVEVIGSAEDTGSDFIETPFKHGEVIWNPRSGIYKLSTTRVSLDQWRKDAKENPDHVFENTSTIGNRENNKLEFAQIDGKFVFTKMKYSPFITREGATEIYSTLKDAKEREGQVRRLVHQEVVKHTNKSLPSDKTLGEIIQQIEQIEKRVHGIDSKQRTESEKRRATNGLKDLIESLKTQLEG